MTSYVTPRKNVAFKFYVALVDQTNTKLTKANPTIASGDFKVSTDGGAFANLATLPSANPASGRAVMIDCSAGEMNGDNIVVQCVDAAGAEWCDLILNIQTTARQIDDLAFPATTGRSMVVDANGLVDANMVKSGPTGSGTAQTAGDIYSKVSALTYTVANQVDVNVVDWKGAAAAAMTGDAFARLGAPAGVSVSADIAAAKVDTAAIKVQTDKLTFTVTNQVDVNVLDWKSATAPAMTGDAFARLGAPAGASTSADIAAVKVDTAAVKVQTDKLTFTVSNVLDANMLRTNGDATAAANVAKTTRAIIRCTVGAASTTTSIVTSACAPSGVDADQFKGRIITFDADTTTTGLRGQSTDITASTAAATPTLTVTALTQAPASGDTFSIT